MSMNLAFRLNGKPVRLDVDGERPLLWVLRTDLGMTGTKFGCGEGSCGACTVFVNGEPTRSCGTPVKSVAGKSVITIEGLERDGRLHPVQDAFVRHEAMQCGFCTPGLILEAVGLLAKNPQPTAQDVIEGLNEHLCRCGTHPRVVRAVQDAAARMKSGAVG